MLSVELNQSIKRTYPIVGVEVRS